MSLKTNLPRIVFVFAAVSALAFVGAPCRAETLVPITLFPADGPPEIRSLVSGLYAGDPVLRGNAARLLGERGKKAAAGVPFLIGILHDKAGIRVLVNGRIAGITDPASLARTALFKIDPRWKDGEAVRFVTGYLLEDFKRSGSERQQQLAQVFCDIDRPVQEEFMTAACRAGSPAVRRTAVSCTVNPAHIAEALKDPAPEVRKEAVWRLGLRKDPRRGAMLSGMLKDPISEVREAAAIWIGGCREAGVADALIAVLNDREPRVRQFALSSLAETGDPRTFDCLSAALKDKNGDVVLEAIRSLTKLKDPRAVPTIVGMLQHESGYARASAAWALGELGDARAIEALTAAQEDAEADVRKRAKEALAKIARP